MPSRRSEANPLARSCARCVDTIADLIEDASVVYDEDVPPSVPPGETLAEWRTEHTRRIRHPRLLHVGLRLRRVVRRLEGPVINTRGDQLPP